MVIYISWLTTAYPINPLTNTKAHEFHYYRYMYLINLLNIQFYENIRLNEKKYFIIKYWTIKNGYVYLSNYTFNGVFFQSTEWKLLCSFFENIFFRFLFVVCFLFFVCLFLCVFVCFLYRMLRVQFVTSLLIWVLYTASIPS
jgi:hypothetical protein